MIFLNALDSRPIYEQVVERFKLLILKGVIIPDEKIPSVRNMAVDLSLNPNTIQRAYAELERQGYIYTVKGKGNFAADSAGLLLQFKKEILEQIREICEMAVSVGITEEEIVEGIRKRRDL